MARYSVLNDNLNECIICGTSQNIHIHHVFRGAYRKKSEKRHFIVPLCIYHHTGSNCAVHNNKQFDLKLKKFAQKYYEEHYGTREDFIKEFGKNYLD